ncbi:HutD/Ves family protein [Streptomyces lydicus]|uniref:HutD-family protein n=1 Tax=Streptomyces lydicus TaxID=47763 RepID=A0A1D7VSQ7_9ACTN|nr:HutD family protein [Streptomyces lydicus]AOP49812.1 hypothetical protein SL103_29390 [Streptomyces lydicus]
MTGEVHLLRAAERSAAPWSNGGGVTREVAAHPPGAGWDGFAWRVSLAEVGRDGPYSPLPGVRRILTVVEGGGLELTVDGTRHLLADRYRPFAFPGGAATDCRLLAGPVVNLNVMLRDGRAAATVETVRGTRALPTTRSADPDAEVPDALVVVALQGPALLAVAERPPVRLGRFDAALLSGTRTAAAELRTEGTAAVIALTAGR